MGKQYTNAFKSKHIKEALRATKLHQTTVAGYAKKHEIPHTTLHQWINQYTRGTIAIEKKPSFVQLSTQTPSPLEHVEPIVITTSFCTLTLPTSISSLDLIKVMKSLKEVPSCS